jgi:hypothetical protein
MRSVFEANDSASPFSDNSSGKPVDRHVSELQVAGGEILRSVIKCEVRLSVPSRSPPTGPPAFIEHPDVEPVCGQFASACKSSDPSPNDPDCSPAFGHQKSPRPCDRLNDAC